MADYYTDKRYGINDKRTHLEIIPVPDLFLAADFNTNTELILEFLDTFFKETYGAIRKSGYVVNIVGNDFTITAGDLWWGKYLARTTASTSLVNGRIAATQQYIYAKITNTRYTLADDLVSESNIADVFIRQNVNGTDLSRPNQYIYTVELEAHVALQTDSVGNLPDNPDIEYVLVASVSDADVITYDAKNFGQALSSADLDYETIPTDIANLLADVEALYLLDDHNAKIDEDNTFTKMNSYSPTEATYNSSTKAITLADTNIQFINVAGTLIVESITAATTGSVIRLKLDGSGSILFTHGTSLITPGEKNLSVSFGNWVELVCRIAGKWELTSNSTQNTVLLANQGGVPVGSLIAFEGTLEEFDGTGLGFGSKSGWAICNGQNSTGDARGRNLVGLSTGDPDFNSLGVTGGAKSVTITQDNLPAHTHSGTTVENGQHIHDLQEGSGGTATNSPGEPHNNLAGMDTAAGFTDGTKLVEAAGAHTHSFTTSSVGGNQQLSILNPFYTVVWIKRLS